MSISMTRCFIYALAIFAASPSCKTDADNQTPDVSLIHSGAKLPFRVEIEEADFELPDGLHSGVFATHDGKWLLLAGRTNGMHTFANDDDNFPPRKQNTDVYVIDPHKRKTYKRSLYSRNSGLSQNQIDLLSVTSPQFYQEGSTLYITGGYGVNTPTGSFSTKEVLSAIDIPGLMHWTMHDDCSHTALSHIRQIFDPIFRVTGGYMTRMDNHDTLLVFGQNFEGFYVAESNGIYTQQVRRFRIIDDGTTLSVEIKNPLPSNPDPNFRRRDLNVVPAIEWVNGKADPYLIALSGVFTLSGGAWTVPVTVNASGYPEMDDPADPKTFKQGMNNYVSPSIGLFSKEDKKFYGLLLGGISYGYFENGEFVTDSELPFINQSTAISRNGAGHFKQYILDTEYPFIPSKGANKGNPLLFGAGALYIIDENLPIYPNGVAKLDKIDEPTVIGYVVGGIQSSVPNTETRLDSAASCRVFKVILSPKGCHR